MKKKLLQNVIELNKKQPRNKGLTVKVTQENYNKIKIFCKENNCKIGEILNFKILELIKEIDKYNK